MSERRVGRWSAVAFPSLGEDAKSPRGFRCDSSMLDVVRLRACSRCLFACDSPPRRTTTASSRAAARRESSVPRERPARLVRPARPADRSEWSNRSHGCDGPRWTDGPCRSNGIGRSRGRNWGCWSDGPSGSRGSCWRDRSCWTSRCNRRDGPDRVERITGPTGATGASGSTGVPGATGATGALVPQVRPERRASLDRLAQRVLPVQLDRREQPERRVPLDLVVCRNHGTGRSCRANRSNWNHRPRWTGRRVGRNRSRDPPVRPGQPEQLEQPARRTGWCDRRRLGQRDRLGPAGATGVTGLLEPPDPLGQPAPRERLARRDQSDRLARQGVTGPIGATGRNRPDGSDWCDRTHRTSRSDWCPRTNRTDGSDGRGWTNRRRPGATGRNGRRRTGWGNRRRPEQLAQLDAVGPTGATGVARTRRGQDRPVRLAPPAQLAPGTTRTGRSNWAQPA